MIKKADIILAAVLIIAGLAMSYMLSFGQEAGSRAEIYSDGKLYGIYALEIKDGSMYMKSEDCNGHDCISQGSISKTGQSIICLPNKIVAEITGGSSELDAVAR